MVATRLLRAGDHHPCRAQHAVAELVAPLQDLDHGPLLGLGRLREQRLVDVWVELALGLDLGQALARQRLGQGAMHEPNAVLELRLLVLLGSAERPLEVVEDGQELLDQPLVGARDQALLIARRPLAVVVELGLDALERVDQLLVLGPQGLGLVDLDLLDLLAVLDLLRHYEVFASSSSMTS